MLQQMRILGGSISAVQLSGYALIRKHGPWSSAVFATWRQASCCPSSACAKPFLSRSGPLEQRRLRNMEAGILLASSRRAAKPPTLVVQPDNELVCARKLSAVLGGGCSPQGVCLAPSPQRGIPALMQHRRALDAIGPQCLQGEAQKTTVWYDIMLLLKGRRSSSLTCWQANNLFRLDSLDSGLCIAEDAAPGQCAACKANGLDLYQCHS